MKVKKLLLLGVALIALLISVFAMTGCYGNYNTNGELLNGYEPQYLFFQAGEERQLDWNKFFQCCDINVAKVEAESSQSSVFTAGNNGKIKAVGAGDALLYTTVYDKNSQTKLNITAAKVYVIDPSKMTEIKTAQDLSDIRNNLTGSYILKADIDLKNFGDWEPVGTDAAFRGSFVNIGGYKIKNLTISPAGVHIQNAGLFGSLSEAYIDGLILENVNIDVTDYADCPNSFSSAGGISGEARTSVIRNCVVDGRIAAQRAEEYRTIAAAGIVGTFWDSAVSFSGGSMNNSFEGNLTITRVRVLLDYRRDIISPSEFYLFYGRSYNLPSGSGWEYVFSGWNTKRDGSGINVPLTGESWPFPQGVTLYAQWGGEIK